MDAQRWQQIANFLERVEALPADERASFLEKNCDEDTRREVASLLRADVARVSFLNRPLFAGPELTGRKVGPFTIIRELAQGGMGTVFLAKQDEPARMVALNFLAPFVLGPESRKRFEFEQSVLARMSHSYIAKIHGSGSSEDGTPYFAMEYIDGLPLTVFCDTHRLSLTQRLDLFVKVCEAISHAHSKGIIHRDIKPSNVLVVLENEVPTPKVIDFGIARSLDVDPGLTREGTPAPCIT